MYIVALNGSHNDNGNTAYLLKTILGKCKERGAETEMINVYKAVSDAKYPFCVNCSNPCNKQCYKDTLLMEAYEKVTKADFVIIGSPVYFGSMSGQLKAFFDKTRAIRGEKLWLGKPMAGVTVGASKYGGQEKALDAIHNCMLVNGMTVVGTSSSHLAGHMGICAQAPASDDEFAVSRAHSGAKRIFEEISKR